MTPSKRMQSDQSARYARTLVADARRYVASIRKPWMNWSYRNAVPQINSPSFSERPRATICSPKFITCIVIIFDNTT